MSALTPIQFYTGTQAAWDAMFADIEAAKRSIIFEQYIFVNDSVGQKFFDALRKKAREGVKVRLMIDMVGSFSFYRSDLPEVLKTEGIGLMFFNPISPSRIANFTSNFFRDHRKILVIDDEIAHIGGVGIQEHMAKWRDTHMRLTGPLVEHLRMSFEDVWEGAKKGFYIRYSKFNTFVKKYELLTNSPSIRQRYIYQNMLAQIRNAKKYIYLTTPYFIPDVPLYRALYLAAKRGVDVRILVPEMADHLFVNHARESYFTLALKAGMKIYVYQPIMMHAKTAVIDDEWATAGSFNLDSLSFFFNHEANLISSDGFFIEEIKKHFFEDLKVSREIILAEWKKRPLSKKFLELLTWLFHGIM
jgi:cardiolipin synthase